MPRDRSVGTFRQPLGLGPADHACWWFEDRAGYLADVVTYLAEGADAGDQLWYVAAATEDQRRKDLAALPDLDALLGRGQLRLLSVADFFGDLDAFDGQDRLRAYHAEAMSAVAEGWRTARYAVDGTALAVAVPAATLTAFELALDALVVSDGTVVLCGYDARRTPPGRGAEAVHPVQHPPHPPLGFSLHCAGRGRRGFRLTGEIDVDTAEDLAGALASAAAASSGPFVLDLGDLAFLDAAATRVLASHALALQVEGRGVELVAPRPAAAYCLEAFDLGGLVVRTAADA